MMQVKGPFRFRELSRAEIGDNVWLVVSERSDGRIVVARANVAVAEGRPKTMYMPDPLIMNNREALGAAGNCLLDAFERLEARNADKQNEKDFSQAK